MTRKIVPGEILPAPGEITLNEGRDPVTVMVANTGDRPIQVGSHYHFAETNPALDFDRAASLLPCPPTDAPPRARRGARRAAGPKWSSG